MTLLKLKHRINRNALKLAAFSACFGILLVLISLITKPNILLEIGLYHLFPTIPIHLFVLIWVVINAFKNPKELAEHFFTLFIMLLNIPLAFLCAFLGLSHL